MGWKEKVTLFLSIINSVALVYLLFQKTPDYSKQLNSLELELSSIKNKRDSIRERIDTVTIKIKENEKYYKETINTIISNNPDDDYVFFLNYLKNNRERFSSNNNSDSVKGN